MDIIVFVTSFRGRKRKKFIALEIILITSCSSNDLQGKDLNSEGRKFLCWRKLKLFFFFYFFLQFLNTSNQFCSGSRHIGIVNFFTTSQTALENHNSQVLKVLKCTRSSTSSTSTLAASSTSTVKDLIQSSDIFYVCCSTRSD